MTKTGVFLENLNDLIFEAKVELQKIEEGKKDDNELNQILAEIATLKLQAI